MGEPVGGKQKLEAFRSSADRTTHPTTPVFVVLVVSSWFIIHKTHFFVKFYLTPSLFSISMGGVQAVPAKLFTSFLAFLTFFFGFFNRLGCGPHEPSISDESF